MASKIYTKSGDQGSTTLLGGKKVSKSHRRIEAYGTVDELNSFIGLCRDLLYEHKVQNILLRVQDRLFTIGSSLAVEPGKEIKINLPSLEETDISQLEFEMDDMTSQLPPLQSFILPGGHTAASALHVARSVCRRAERCCVRLHKKEKEALPLVIQYLNRLSDYLFVLSRFTSLQLHADEIVWKP